MYKNYWGFLFLYFEEWPCLFSRQESFSPVKPLPVRPLTARSRQEVLHLLLLFYFDLHQLTSMYTYTFSPVYICPVRHPLHSNSLLFPPPIFFCSSLSFFERWTLLLRFVYLAYMYWNVRLFFFFKPSYPFTLYLTLSPRVARSYSLRTSYMYRLSAIPPGHSKDRRI